MLFGKFDKLLTVPPFMKKHKNKCPCTAGDILYSSCCQPIHINHLLADTPEKLMRARYSAYALKRDDFIIDTWSPATRPSQLSLDNTLDWISLRIEEATDVDPFQKQGTVTFSATYILDGNFFFFL